jgi:8-oxo-dGTP diphosphatase
MNDQNQTKVGVGLFIVKGNSILLGRRKNAHGPGEYAGAGGHLEHLELFEDAALRELREEMGEDIQVRDLKLLSLTNLRKYRPKHYIDIGIIAEWVSGEPKVMEPDKIESWQWFDMDELPGPLFGIIPNYVEAFKTGRVYFPES